MISYALYALLAQDSAISTLVGDRISPLLRQEGEPLPALVYETGAIKTDRTLDGIASGIVSVNAAIECWADSYAGAKALSDAVITRLDGFIGTVSHNDAGDNPVTTTIGYIEAQIDSEDAADSEFYLSYVTATITYYRS